MKNRKWVERADRGGYWFLMLLGFIYILYVLGVSAGVFGPLPPLGCAP